MSDKERLQRMKSCTGLTSKELAAIFGVDESTCKAWLHGKNRMHPDIRTTLTRLETEAFPKLSPKIGQGTVRAFYEGMRKARSA